MNPNSRRLCFTVGTGLLTASLSLATTGCKKNTVNTAPPAEDPHVNVAAPDDGGEDTPAEEPAEDDASDAVESPDAEGEAEGEAESPE